LFRGINKYISYTLYNFILVLFQVKILEPVSCFGIAFLILWGSGQGQLLREGGKETAVSGKEFLIMSNNAGKKRWRDGRKLWGIG
jgi:predicted membrane chloride channel (bestrophin family)